MIRLFPVLAVCLAGAASAQDLDYSDQQTLTCMSETPSEVPAHNCAGKSAFACMTATTGGESTVGMGGCLSRELQFWDDLLNANYRARMAEAKRIDAEMKDMGATVASQAAALRAMQRAWIPFRDAACDYERSQWGGGTGGGPATLACLMDMTAQQAVLLGRSSDE